MIAVDTSSLIAYLEGESGADVEAVDAALEHGQAALPPVVLTELLSDPKLGRTLGKLLTTLPLVELMDGYWERAGRLRSTVIAKKRRARIADSLIAQSCIDHNLMLVTRDTDFRYYARISKLKLL